MKTNHLPGKPCAHNMPASSGTPCIDITRTPYSRRGSYLCLLYRHKTEMLPEGLYLRSVHGGARTRELLMLEPTRNGKVVPYTIEADARSVRMVTKAGSIEVCLADVDLLRFRGQGLGLRLNRNQDSWGECAMPAPNGRWELNSHIQRLKCMFHPLKGAMRAQFDYCNPGMKNLRIEYTPDKNGIVEGAIEEFHRGWTGRTITQPFSAAADALEREFGSWLAAMPVPAAAQRNGFSATRTHAAYLNWSSLVRPEGHLTREGMLMSKVIMTSIWSWDNCFNALATAAHDQDLAWHQFMIPFDHQTADGCLPDVIDNSMLFWAFNKPPIQGWFLRQFAGIPGMLTRARMAECYEPLGRWTEWWFSCRDYDGDGVVQCNHGNDNGWDNATVFDLGLPVETPDLMAYLVIQCDMLGDMASRLGRPAAAAKWRRLGTTTLKRLLHHSRRGNQFVSPRSGDHALTPGSDSLLNYIPIILGMRLPAEMRRAMIAALGDESRFCGAAGPASEALSSPLYQSDGYWRGPVWAPSTALIVDGLRQCGATALAKELSLRFCRACVKSGFAENFDAQTGKGFCDSAHTWTSSVFLHLLPLLQCPNKH